MFRKQSIDLSSLLGRCRCLAQISHFDALGLGDAGGALGALAASAPCGTMGAVYKCGETNSLLLVGIADFTITSIMNGAMFNSYCYNGHRNGGFNHKMVDLSIAM